MLCDSVLLISSIMSTYVNWQVNIFITPINFDFESFVLIKHIFFVYKNFAPQTNNSKTFLGTFENQGFKFLMSELALVMTKYIVSQRS